MGTQEHDTGAHTAYSTLGGSCTYSGTTPGAPCSISCRGTAATPTTITSTIVPNATGVQEIGELDTVIDLHYSGVQNSNGAAASNGPAIQCSGTAAAAVQSCAVGAFCDTTVTINGTASGIGATVTFPPGKIFGASTPYPISCGARTLPAPPPPPPPPPICLPSDGESPDDPKCPPTSPIIVDTTGGGFHLTSADEGVVFDIRGDGHPIKLAWTAGNWGNAFLALDRNHNGKIDSGKELFGNFTAQPATDHPNGYLALAEFDKPENGGNGDGIIDSHDEVFSHLLLWIDENHDGVSQPNELHTLPELGVYSINLKYRDDQHFFDEYGNWFHYQSALNPDPADGISKDGRTTYDVFFVAATPQKQK